MHSKYIELFKEIAKSVSISAEQVMDYDKQKNDTEGYDAAQMLRNDFNQLYDKVRNEKFDGKLNKNDFSQLLVGSYIIMSQLQDRINSLKTAMSNYQTDLVPKLQDIIDNGKTDEEVIAIAEEKFSIKEEN